MSVPRGEKKLSVSLGMVGTGMMGAIDVLVQLQAGPELETDTVRNIRANRGRKYGQRCLLSFVLRSSAPAGNVFLRSLFGTSSYS